MEEGNTKKKKKKSHGRFGGKVKKRYTFMCIRSAGIVSD